MLVRFGKEVQELSLATAERAARTSLGTGQASAGAGRERRMSASGRYGGQHLRQAGDWVAHGIEGNAETDRQERACLSAFRYRTEPGKGAWAAHHQTYWRQRCLGAAGLLQKPRRRCLCT